MVKGERLRGKIQSSLLTAHSPKLVTLHPRTLINFKISKLNNEYIYLHITFIF